VDLLTFVIAIAIIGFAIQLSEFWVVLGITMILILASKDIKASILLILSVFVLYFINSMGGMKEYWFMAIIVLLALGYIMGLGKEEAPADPYAGLLGGMGGMGGMPGGE